MLIISKCIILFKRNVMQSFFIEAILKTQFPVEAVQKWSVNTGVGKTVMLRNLLNSQLSQNQLADCSRKTTVYTTVYSGCSSEAYCQPLSAQNW